MSLLCFPNQVVLSSVAYQASGFKAPLPPEGHNDTLGSGLLIFEVMDLGCMAEAFQVNSHNPKSKCRMGRTGADVG